MTETTGSRIRQERILRRLQYHARRWRIFWAHEDAVDVWECLRQLAREAGLKAPPKPWAHLAPESPQTQDFRLWEVGWQVIPDLLPVEEAIKLIVTLAKKLGGDANYDAAANALWKIDHPMARHALQEINRD